MVTALWIGGSLGGVGVTQAQKRGPSDRSWTYSGDGQQELRPQGERLTGGSWGFWLKASTSETPLEAASQGKKHCDSSPAPHPPVWLTIPEARGPRSLANTTLSKTEQNKERVRNRSQSREANYWHITWLSVFLWLSLCVTEPWSWLSLMWVTHDSRAMQKVTVEYLSLNIKRWKRITLLMVTILQVVSSASADTTPNSSGLSFSFFFYFSRLLLQFLLLSLCLL